MTFNYDKIKHTAGLVALGAIPLVSPLPHYGKWIALGCGAVAFICGALSEALFTKEAVATLQSPEVKP